MTGSAATGGEGECSSTKPLQRLIVDLGKVSLVISKMTSQFTITDEEEYNFDYLTAAERTIGRAPSVEAYNKWAANEKRLICDFIDGKIIVRELPTTPHGAAQGNINLQFGIQGGDHLVITIASDIVSRVNGDLLSPDVTMHVDGVSNVPGGSVNQVIFPMYPVLVVEIACSQRPLELHERATRFLGDEMPAVEYYVGIQRYNVRATDGLQGLVAAVYTRVNPTIPVNIVSFGTGPLHYNSWWSMNSGINNFPNIIGVGYGGPPCNAPGIPLYTLEFPAATIFNTRNGGIPDGVPNIFTLDLFPVQKQLRRSSRT